MALVFPILEDITWMISVGSIASKTYFLAPQAELIADHFWDLDDIWNALK